MSIAPSASQPLSPVPTPCPRLTCPAACPQYWQCQEGLARRAQGLADQAASRLHRVVQAAVPAPGLCGAASCPGACHRLPDCPAGQRRVRQSLGHQAIARSQRRATPRQLAICERVKEAGQCPTLCNACGGCFMPQVNELRSEATRSIHRAEDCLDMLIATVPGARS